MRTYRHLISPVTCRYGDAGGFLLSFFFIYIGMCALGLSLEAMITIFTPRFVPFFLFTLVSERLFFDHEQCD